jgi:SAM-dependent methyltransferase
LRAAYARHAPRYDADFFDQQRPKILGLAAAAPAETGPAVDLGAGTGLVARLTGRPLLSVDLCPQMLAFAPEPRVAADMWALPFENAVFAEAWCVTALIDPGDHRPPLLEVARVLRPGGLLRLSVLRAGRTDLVENALISAGFHITRRLDLGVDSGLLARTSAHVDTPRVAG